VRVRRPVLVVLVVGALFGVVLVVLSALLVARRDPSQTLVEPEEVPDADLRLAMTLTSVDVQAGELTIRVVPTPLGQDSIRDGLLTRGFRLYVNDISGEGTHTFSAGDPLHSIDLRVALTGGSAFEYPFDDYTATALVIAADEASSSEGTPLTVESTTTSSLVSHSVTASHEEDCEAIGATCLALEVGRPVSTIGYGIWFIVLVWSLALAGVGVLYTVVRRGVELPLWAFGYLVGVLFALPPLRSSLPGTPPVGGFVDFVAYYWAVAVVSLTLIIFIVVWIRENRRAPQPR
jgi:hypothetical protein